MRIISMLSAAKRFNRPSTTAISKENRGRLSRLHDLATYARTEDSFDLVSRKRCLFPRYIPKLRFPSFYVTLVSTQRVRIPTCTRYVHSHVRGAIRPIRFASRVHAHAKSGRYLRIASTLALKAHSVTPRRSRLIASAKPLPPKAPAKITEKESSRRSETSPN